MFSIILQAENAEEIRDTAPDDGPALLAWLRAQLGGHRLRRIGLPSGREMWVTPDGIGQGRPVNRTATAVAGLSKDGADTVYGNAVVLL